MFEARAIISAENFEVANFMGIPMNEHGDVPEERHTNRRDDFSNLMRIMAAQPE